MHEQKGKLRREEAKKKHVSGSYQLAEWTLKLRVAKTEIDIEPEIVQRIGGFVLSKDSEFKESHTKLTQSYPSAGSQNDQGDEEAANRRRYMEKKREMKAVEKSKTFTLKNDKKGSKKQQEKEKAFAEKMRLRKEKQPQKKKRSSDINYSPNIFPLSNNRTMDPLNSIS